MLHPRRRPAPRTAALTAVALGLACLSTQPVQAEESKKKDAKEEKAAHALIAPAYMSGQNGASIFLINTGDATVRAVVAIREHEGPLVGCSSGLLKSGEADFLYFQPGPVYLRSGPSPDTALTIKVYGFAQDGSLDRKDLEEQDGLAGNVTLLDGGAGEPTGIVELLEVSTTARDRSSDLEECRRVGFSTTLGSASSEQESTSSEKDKGDNIIKTSSKSSTERKDDDAKKERDKDDDEDDDDDEEDAKKDRDKDDDDEDDDDEEEEDEEEEDD